MIDKNEKLLSDTIRSGNVSAARAICDAHPELLKKQYRGFFPWLTIAAQEGNVDMVSFLIEKGLDVNEREKDEKPRNWPLQAAIVGDHVETVQLLLAHGAYPKCGKTPDCSHCRI